MHNKYHPRAYQLLDVNHRPAHAFNPVWNSQYRSGHSAISNSVSVSTAMRTYAVTGLARMPYADCTRSIIFIISVMRIPAGFAI